MGGVIPVILLESTDITVWKGLLKNTKFCPQTVQNGGKYDKNKDFFYNNVKFSHSR